MATFLATFIERGNGFPDVGDYVVSDSGDLYEITQALGAIRTNDPRGNSMTVHIVKADWEDCEEGSEREGTLDNIRPLVDVGDKVEGGHGEDHDTGRVESVDGDVAYVAWDSGVKTTAPIARLTVVG